jgi:hypothetical protein
MALLKAGLDHIQELLKKISDDDTSLRQGSLLSEFDAMKTDVGINSMRRIKPSCSLGLLIIAAGTMDNKQVKTAFTVHRVRVESFLDGFGSHHLVRDVIPLWK